MLSPTVSSVVGTCGPVDAAVSAGKVYVAAGRFVKIIDYARGHVEIFSHGLNENVTQISLSRSQKVLAAVGTFGVVLYHTQKKCTIGWLKCKSRIDAFRFCNRTEAFGLALGHILEIWSFQASHVNNWSTFLLVNHYSVGTPILDMSWHMDDKALFLGCTDHSCKVLYTDGQRQPVHIAAKKDAVIAVHMLTELPFQILYLTRDRVLTHMEISNGTVKVMNISKISGSGTISSACFDASGRFICVRSSFDLTLIDVSTREQLMYKDLSETLLSKTRCRFDEHVSTIAVIYDDEGGLIVWDWSLDTIMYQQKARLSHVTAAALSQDGTCLLLGTASSEIEYWKMPFDASVATFTQHAKEVTDVTFFASNDAFVSSSLDGTARAYDLQRLKNFRTFTSPAGSAITHVSVDRSGEILCGATTEHYNILLWSIKSGQLLDVLIGHESPLVALHICQETSHVISSSWDKTTRVWNIYSTDHQVLTLAHSTEVETACLSSCGKMIATASSDGRVHLWKYDGSLVGSFEASDSQRKTPGALSSRIHLGFVRSASILAVARSNQQVHFYDTATCALIKRHDVVSYASVETASKVVRMLPANDGATLALCLTDEIIIMSDQSVQASSMNETVTEQSIYDALQHEKYASAMAMSIILADVRLFNSVIYTVPETELSSIVDELPLSLINGALRNMLDTVEASPHLERSLLLLKQILQKRFIDVHSSSSSLSLASKLNTLHGKVCSRGGSRSILDFICSQSIVAS